MIEVFRYQREDGIEPVTDWLKSLRDKRAEAKIRVRLKKTQPADIKAAKKYWADWKRRQS